MYLAHAPTSQTAQPAVARPYTTQQIPPAAQAVPAPTGPADFVVGSYSISVDWKSSTASPQHCTPSKEESAVPSSSEQSEAI